MSKYDVEVLPTPRWQMSEGRWALLLEGKRLEVVHDPVPKHLDASRVYHFSIYDKDDLLLCEGYCKTLECSKEIASLFAVYDL